MTRASMTVEFPEAINLGNSVLGRVDWAGIAVARSGRVVSGNRHGRMCWGNIVIGMSRQLGERALCRVGLVGSNL